MTVPSARPFGRIDDDGIAGQETVPARAARSASAPSRIERKLGQQERIGAADGRELDADKRARRPGTHDGLYISGWSPGPARGESSERRERPQSPTLDLESEPVGDDLRAGVPIERRKRPVDR